jgi:CBS domain-containing protein
MESVISMTVLVKDVMVQNVFTIDPTTSIKEAAELMNRYEIGCLLVVSNQEPAGIITERDMLRRVFLKSRDPVTTQVSDIMSAPLIASSPETDLREALQLMNERRIKRLPIVKDNSFVGLLTVTDVMLSLAFLDHIANSMCSRCKASHDSPTAVNIW